MTLDWSQCPAVEHPWQGQRRLGVQGNTYARADSVSQP